MGKSSKDKRDIYYRMAKEDGWRARSAYKLLQLDEEFHFLKDFTRVVDLCAAPGSWSQVLSRCCKDQSDCRIVAVDLQPMAPIRGVETIQADITHPDTVKDILSRFEGAPADLVVSDGAPDVTGLHDLDEFIQAQLVYCAVSLATAVLKPGGTFIAKIFRGRDIDLLYAQMGRIFKTVHCAKPRSSRASSLEAFIVCQNYQPRAGWNPEQLLAGHARVDTNGDGQSSKVLPIDERAVAPFLACGDLSSYDSDATYNQIPKAATLDPVRSPIAPAYKEALQMKKQGVL